MSFYFFGKNWNLKKDVLFDTMNDTTYVVVAIYEFININKYNAVSALNCFVDKENED